MEFLRAGIDLLCSDLDVVWLSDPRPFLVGDAPGTGLLPFADVGSLLSPSGVSICTVHSTHAREFQLGNPPKVQFDSNSSAVTV